MCCVNVFVCRIKKRVQYLFLINGDPVGGGEPPVIFDVVHSIPQISIPLRQIDLQKIPQKFFQFGRKVGGEAHFSGDDFLINLNRLVGEERRISGGHFINEYT